MTDTNTATSDVQLPENVDAALAEMERVESGLPEGSAPEPSDAQPDAQNADEKPADDAAESDAKPDDRPRGDPRVALREERERRRAAEAEVQKARENLAQMAAVLHAMRQQLPKNQQQPEPAEQPPDFNQDPAGYLRYQVETLRNQLSTVNAEIQRRAQLESAQQQFAEAVSTVNRFESEFAQSNPDYYDAVDYMRERLAKKLEITGTPKDQIPGIVAQQMRTFGIVKLRAGQNPAEQIFALAKLEGYTGPRESTSAKLSAVAQGQAGSRGARPSAPATQGKLTPESLAQMSYSELAKLDDDAWQRAWEQ